LATLQRPKVGGDVVWDVAGVYRPMVVYRPHENTGENPGTPEPAASLVVPQFPRSQYLEVIIQKSAESGRNYWTVSDGNR